MTDRRATDLCNGRPGRALYDLETKRWSYSVDCSREQQIKPLLPLIKWVDTSTQTLPESSNTPSRDMKKQLKWLSKVRPETVPAKEVVSEIMRAERIEIEFSTHIGSLLAMGRALDPERISGMRTPRVLAMPCGEAGEVLRLIRPRVQTRGWGTKGAARLCLLEPEFSDDGYWIGTGGPIQQIISADENSGSSTWLAVRSETVTTIFRPSYGECQTLALVSGRARDLHQHSRLNPNPVIDISIEKTNGMKHAHVSFNPWYSRQFAVVDVTGSWYIWDIEYAHGKDSAGILVAGKSGSMPNDSALDVMSKTPQATSADGWNRVLWACNLNTLVLCNRRHLAVFDINDGPVKLEGKEILPPRSKDWILDVKRSATNTNHLFVLTTSRVYWVEIHPAGGDIHKPVGPRVLISYRHFIAAEDESLKLTTLKEKNVSVMITSAKIPVIMFYTFWIDSEAGPTSKQGSFTLHQGQKAKDFSAVSLHSTCLLRCPLILSPSRNLSGLESLYLDRDVMFFQLWTFTSNLELSSVLCVFNESHHGNTLLPPRLLIAPDTTLGESSRRRGPRTVYDSFIVPDRMMEDDFSVNALRGSHPLSLVISSGPRNTRPGVNYREIFRRAFSNIIHNVGDFDQDDEILGEVLTMEQFLVRISGRLQGLMEGDTLVSKTLIEAARTTRISDDLEQVASMFGEYMATLNQESYANDTSTLVVSNLASNPESKLPLDAKSGLPDIMKVFDLLVQQWIASLPSTIPNITRLSIFKIIRQFATGLSLSSMAASRKDKASNFTSSLVGNPDKNVSINERYDGTTRESSPMPFSSQPEIALRTGKDSRLPTPAPSMFSQATSESGLVEYSAVTRLRQYCAPIRTVPDFGKASFMEHWESIPLGGDPALYSWEAVTQGQAAEEDNDEDRRRSRKEEARRRRRTKDFLAQDRSRAAEAASELAASQSIALPSGSQPNIAGHVFSSQAVDDLPMTQPSMGVFGSRVGAKGKKKQKKRTAGF